MSVIATIVRRNTAGRRKISEKEINTGKFIIFFKCFSCKILVVGGGTAGCTMAAKLSRKPNNSNQVIVLEPSDVHYYQPLFALIGGDISSFKTWSRHMKDVLPENTKWLKDSVVGFQSDANKALTHNRHHTI